MTEKVTISTEGLQEIPRGIYKTLLKAAEVFVETQTQITDCGVEHKSEEVLAAEDIIVNILAGMQQDSPYVLVEDYKLEVISGLL